MKKSIFFIFLTFALIFGSINASASVASDAKLNISYKQNTDNIIVSAYFSDIAVKDGIISAEYDIKYDNTALELVSIKHIIPEKWNSLIAEENVENFSMQTEDGVYHWGYAVIALGEGAKLDKELGFVAEFKPLKDTVSDIIINYSDLRGEVVEDGKTTEFVHMSSNSAKITYDNFNAANTKLFYADIEPKLSYLRPRYYEVENNESFVFEESTTDVEEINDNNAVVYVVISVVAVLVVALVAFFILKSRRKS
jgi:hypothetical protein